MMSEEDIIVEKLYERDITINEMSIDKISENLLEEEVIVYEIL